MLRVYRGVLKNGPGLSTDPAQNEALNTYKRLQENPLNQDDDLYELLF